MDLSSLYTRAFATALVSDSLVRGNIQTTEQLWNSERAFDGRMNTEDSSLFSGFLNRVSARIKQVQWAIKVKSENGLDTLLEEMGIKNEAKFVGVTFYPHAAVFHYEPSKIPATAGLAYSADIARFMMPKDAATFLFKDATGQGKLEGFVMVEHPTRSLETLTYLLMDLYHLAIPRPQLKGHVESGVATLEHYACSVLSAYLSVAGYNPFESPQSYLMVRSNVLKDFVREVQGMAHANILNLRKRMEEVDSDNEDMPRLFGSSEERKAYYERAAILLPDGQADVISNCRNLAIYCVDKAEVGFNNQGLLGTQVAFVSLGLMMRAMDFREAAQGGLGELYRFYSEHNDAMSRRRMAHLFTEMIA